MSISTLYPPPDGDVSRGPAFITITIVFGLISTASTVLRLSARTLRHDFGWDDLTLAIAVVLLDVQMIFDGLEYQAGGGRHDYYLTPGQAKESLKWNYITEVLLFVIIPLTKISICFFVLRIKNTGWLKWLIYGLMTGLVITTVVPIIVLFAECRPINAFWDKSAGRCWNPRVLNDVNYVQVSYSIFSDCICSLLPVVILWNVQIRLKLKVAVCGLMSLGLTATACAAVRMSLFVGNLGSDLSWNRALISIWCALEENLGIICANLALSRYVYHFFRDSGWTRKTSYQISSTQKSHPPATSAFLRKEDEDSRSQDSEFPFASVSTANTSEDHSISEGAFSKSHSRSCPEDSGTDSCAAKEYV